MFFSGPKALPCRRCGKNAVLVGPLFPHLLRDDQMTCFEDRPTMGCGTPHYLRAWFKDGECRWAYDVYTGRYETDPEDLSLPMKVRLYVPKNADAHPESDAPNPGPVRVFPRRRWTTEELRTIWRASDRKCHLCGRKWRLNQHSRSGWHVDHKIPNVAGGADTEELANHWVACAKCNLSKNAGQRAVDLQVASFFRELVKVRPDLLVGEHGPSTTSVVTVRFGNDDEDPGTYSGDVDFDD